MRWGIWVESRVSDLRWAVRSLRKTPGATAAAVLSLALGIGANTAIFSLVNALLLRSLPVPAPDELHFVAQKGNESRVSWNYPDYVAFRDGVKVPMAAASGVQSVGLQVPAGGADSAELAQGQFVSGNYFATLGVRPEIGRLFNSAEDRQFGAAPYAVLGYDYWRSRFAADPGIVGRTILVNGYPLSIVGVAKRGFAGIDPTTVPGVYVPITMHTEVSRTPLAMWNSRHFWWIRVFGRVPAAASLAATEARLTNIARAQEEAERKQASKAEARGTPIDIRLLPGGRGHAYVRTMMAKPLLLLMGMVGAVLLIASANVANVLLARGAGRARELAVRMALGAGRRRIVTQLLAEGGLMAAVGGLSGVVLAYAGTGRILTRYVPGFGSSDVSVDVSPDRSVLAFTILVSTVAGLLAGLVPALQASRHDLVPALKTDSAGSAGLSRAWLRRGLVAGQVALSLLLLVGAALFARSLGNLRELDLGFRRDNLAVVFVDPSRNGYRGQRLHDFFERLREGVERVPGVRSASLAWVSPLAGSRWNGDLSIDGAEVKAAGQGPVDMNAVGPRFFETMGTPVVVGREFDASDMPTTVPEPRDGPSREPAPELPGPMRAVVNESFARRYLGGGSPIGRRLSMTDEFDAARAYEIVGVVKDVRYFGLREKPEPMVFLPAWRGLGGSPTLAVRTSGDGADLGPAVRHILAGLDASVPLRSIRTAEQQVDDDIALDRLVATLAGIFGAVALLLAAVGLYGVIAYLVTRRTREIGIRLALGASRGGVLWLVMRDAAALVFVGTVVGLAAALGAARLVESLLYGVAPRDPGIVAAVVGMLVAVSAAAVLVPVRRALSIEPSLALREE